MIKRTRFEAQEILHGCCEKNIPVIDIAYTLKSKRRTQLRNQTTLFPLVEEKEGYVLVKGDVKQIIELETRWQAEQAVWRGVSFLDAPFEIRHVNGTLELNVMDRLLTLGIDTEPYLGLERHRVWLRVDSPYHDRWVKIQKEHGIRLYRLDGTWRGTVHEYKNITSVLRMMLQGMDGKTSFISAHDNQERASIEVILYKEGVLRDKRGIPLIPIDGIHGVQSSGRRKYNLRRKEEECSLTRLEEIDIEYGIITGTTLVYYCDNCGEGVCDGGTQVAGTDRTYDFYEGMKDKVYVNSKDDVFCATCNVHIGKCKEVALGVSRTGYQYSFPQTHITRRWSRNSILGENP